MPSSRPYRERVIEVVVEAAARQDEIPALGAVGQIRGAAKAGLVVADQAAEVRVPGDRVGRRGVVEVEDRDGRVRIDDALALVGDVLREQDRLRQLRHRIRRDRRHAPLPVVRYLRRVGLVADLDVDVVEAGDRRDEVARDGFLDGQQRTALVQGEDILPPDRREAVHVVGRVQRADRPHRVLVERAEQHELDDDAARRCLLQHVAQPRDVGLVEARQVEFRATVGVAIGGAARPRADEAPLRRIERVGGDAEVAAGLDVGAREDPRAVQAVGLQRVEVATVVEVEVEDGAVVLTGRDDDRRPATELEVARVVGMEPEGRACGPTRRSRRRRRLSVRTGRRHERGPGRQRDPQEPRPSGLPRGQM